VREVAVVGRLLGGVHNTSSGLSVEVEDPGPSNSPVAASPASTATRNLVSADSRLFPIGHELHCLALDLSRQLSEPLFDFLLVPLWDWDGSASCELPGLREGPPIAG